MTISNMTLVKIAAIGGMATVTMGLALRFQTNNKIKESPFCKEALKEVRSHKAAVHLLGEPIKDRMIRVDERAKNYVIDNSGKYEIPLSGSKRKGVLHLWLNRNDDKSDWDIQRMELGVDNQPDKRLILKS
ncbi:unnamed protein product [Brassicogethes aeneus]|uniref:Uncharacterized protein n=1 Tax=Brassicogethes aeneus TaxID=1431903 RepID=A0A9P0FDV2_BRAAE|nr:unnamed protein product [Brassicogethes aeneus]